MILGNAPDDTAGGQFKPECDASARLGAALQT
ncbi:hypothetical protein ABIE49_002664 [Bradyrhizobium sp. OAE829]